jgi:hypothetical protein
MNLAALANDKPDKQAAPGLLARVTTLFPVSGLVPAPTGSWRRRVAIRRGRPRGGVLVVGIQRVRTRLSVKTCQDHGLTFGFRAPGPYVRPGAFVCLARASVAIVLLRSIAGNR